MRPSIPQFPVQTLESWHNQYPMEKGKFFIVALFIVIIFFAVVGSRFFTIVPAGNVAVATLFGEVQKQHLEEGLHIPVNPLLQFTLYDVKDQTHKETADVPTQDQLQTQIDVSIQYRVKPSFAPQLWQKAGDIQAVKDKYVVPAIRSNLREAGKGIKRAEDFFLEQTQADLQIRLLSSLQEYLEPKGVEIQRVFIRDINLPAFITKAIESKKEREQAVEKQKAELERFRTEQQQLIAKADAELQAAEQQALQRRLLADAQAYEIEQLNKAIANNPVYIQLRAIEAFTQISKDPASKIYFIDSNSPQPLPLMHMGETTTVKASK